MRFIEKLENIWERNNSLVCVGLDPDITKIPEHLKHSGNSLFEFNKAIIDATADLVCAYKPQIAYYSAYSAENELEMTIAYLKENYPKIPIILDAKRGDIGSTAEMYVKEAFDRYKVDAVTVNPYMGTDTLLPFLAKKDKGIIILCRTSNPGAIDIQDLFCQNDKLYQIVANKASKEWNKNSNVLLVVGATYPKELKEIRKIIGDIPLLVPGIGAQGGNIEQAVINGKTKNGTGMIINSSRGIIYAGKGIDFAAESRKATIDLRDEINNYR